MLLKEIIIPQDSVNDQTVTILSLLYKTGDFVKKDQVIIEVESSKATITIETEVDGYIDYLYDEGEEIEFNKAVAKIYDSVTDINENIVNKNITKIINNTNNKDVVKRTIFSKKAQELIVKENINVNIFIGCDFVNAEDITKYLNKIDNFVTKNNNNARNIRSTKDCNYIPFSNSTSINKISSQKKKEIEYLSDVQGSNLNSAINVNVDIKNTNSTINKSLRYFKNSLLPLLIYETSRLLIKYKKLNAFYINNSIAIYNQINIGIAVDIEKGLKVIKIPNTETKNLQEIEQELFDLTNDYLDEKLKLESMLDITFTITDLSGEGVSFFSPLINKNNSAILGISAIDKQLERITLTLVFDHRVTEGKEVARFLNELKTRVESYKLTESENYYSNNQNNICCYKCFRELNDNIKGNITFIKVIDEKGKDQCLCSVCLNF